MNIRRPLALAAAGIALTLAAAACNNSNGETPTPLPLPEPTDAAPTEEATQEPTQDASPWTEEYTSAEIRMYERALQRFTRYEELAEPIWAEGKATDEAEKLFKDFFFGQASNRQFDQLREWEQIGFQISGTPNVHWSKPSLMGNSNLAIDQCIDSTPLQGSQNGEERPTAKKFLRPHLRTISMIKEEGQPWRIVTVSDGSAQGEEIRPCKI